MTSEQAADRIDTLARELDNAGHPETTSVLLALAAALNLGPQGVESLTAHVRFWTQARLNVMPPIRRGGRPKEVTDG